jgi:GntR family transcriptional regulator
MQFDASAPIYQQVVTAIKKEIASGTIHPGDKLPSCRDLAVSYRINPNTAARVYQVLEAQGVAETRRGMGTYVRGDPQLRDTMLREMADGYTAQYVREMKGLGFDREELLKILAAWSDPEEQTKEDAGNRKEKTDA